MSRIHVPEVTLSVRGVDAEAVREALRTLPAALRAELARPAQPDGRGGEVLRFHRTPDPEALSAGIAARIAAEVRGRTSTPTQGG